MCRYCIGECSHTGDNDRLEWRETDGWVTDAESAKSWSAATAPKTAPLAPEPPISAPPPTPTHATRPSAPILRRDGGEGAER